MKKAELKAALTNLEEFKRRIINCSVLITVIKQFKELAEEVLGILVEHPDEFKRIIKDSTDLISIADKLWNYTNAIDLLGKGLLNLIKQDRAGFQGFIKHPNHLCRLFELFPNSVSELLIFMGIYQDEFKRLVTDTRSLCHLSEKAPEKSVQLLDNVIYNSDEFVRLVSSSNDLKKLADHFKGSAAKLIGIVIRDASEFTRLIKDHQDLCTLITAFPNQANALISIIIRDINEFKRLISNCNHLYNLTSKFPEYADGLVDIIIQDTVEFERLIIKSSVNVSGYGYSYYSSNFSNCSSFIRLTETIPKKAPVLVQRIIDNTDYFNSLVTCAHDLCVMAQHFPSYPQLCIEKNPKILLELLKDSTDFKKVIDKFPEYSDILMHYVSNESDIIFKKFIPDVDVLYWIAKRLPNYADVLINRILKNPEYFKSIFGFFCIEKIDHPLSDDQKRAIIQKELVVIEKRSHEYGGETYYLHYVGNGNYSYDSKKVDSKMVYCSVLLGHIQAIKVGRIVQPDLILKLIPELGSFHLISVKILCALVELFPKYERQLLQLYLNDPIQSKAIISTVENVCMLTKQFPDDKTVLFDLLFQALQLSSVIINDRKAFFRIIEEFPERANQLIQLISKSADHLRYIISSSEDLYLVAERFPEYAELLIKQSFSQHLIWSHDRLIEMIAKLPNHSDLIIAGTLKQFKKSFDQSSSYSRDTVLRDCFSKQFGYYDRYYDNRDHDSTKFSLYDVKFINFLLENNNVFTSILQSTSELCALGRCTEKQYDLIQHVILQPGLFEKFIYDYNTLWMLARSFPNQANLLIKKVIDSNDSYKKIMKHNAVCRISLDFPEHAELTIGKILNSSHHYVRIIKNVDQLIELMRHYPQHKDQLIQPILKKNADYNRIIKTASALCRLTACFPEYSKVLVRKLYNDDEYQRIVKTADALCEVRKTFPENDEILKRVNKTFSDLSEFKRIVKQASHIRILILHFPSLEDCLIGLVTKYNVSEFEKLITGLPALLELKKDFPKCAELLIQSIVENITLFKQVVKSTKTFIKLIENFPEFTRSFIQIIFRNPKEFKRLIKTPSDLNRIAKYYPHSILSKS